MIDFLRSLGLVVDDAIEEFQSSVRDRLADKGRLIILAPHARDFLKTPLECEAFRRFTFWSEHLILHTRESLAVFIKAAGFNEVQIKGNRKEKGNYQ